MKRKKSSGTMVILFNTDLEKTGPMDESKFTPLQRECFQQLSADEQDEIRKGHGASVVDLASGRTICDFNMENYQPPQSAIESLARALLPQIKEHFAQEANLKQMEGQRGLSG